MTRKLTNLEKLQLQHQEMKNLYIDMMVVMKKSLVKSEKILSGIVEEEETVKPVEVEPVEDILFVGYKFRMHGSSLQIEDIPHDRQLKIPCSGMFETVKDGFVNKTSRDFYISRESIEALIIKQREDEAEAKALEDEAAEILEEKVVA